LYEETGSDQGKIDDFSLCSLKKQEKGGIFVLGKPWLPSRRLKEI
jgi:hypothetical protein